MGTTSDFRATPTVIVGGGPTGYAAALVLAHYGWSSLTLLERSQSYDRPENDTTRSFSYLVNQRAINLLSIIPGLLPIFVAEGASSPDVARVTHKPSGATLRSRLPVGAAGQSPSGIPSFFIRRSRFLQILSSHLQKVYGAQVQVLHGCECKAVDIHANGCMNVRVQRSESNEDTLLGDKSFVLQASLVLACDGVNSVVRSELIRSISSASGSSSRTVSSMVESVRGFEMDYWTSAAVGLQYKTIRLPSRPVVAPPGDLTEDVPRALPDEMHFFVERKERRRSDEVFNIGLFPVGSDDSGGRFGTIVRKSDHAIWRLSRIQDAYEMFEENFPQLRVRDLISHSEMSRFVEARPSAFPRIQRCRSLVGLIGSRENKAGVALLGDAAHCFPPDLGLGVNSAIEDVLLLCNILEKEAASERGGSIHAALKLYEKERDTDISALMRMMVEGGPYQYGQDAVGAALWRMNIALRGFLSALFPNTFSPQLSAFARGNMRYSEVLDRVDATTRRMVFAGCVLASVLSAIFLQLLRYLS